MKRLTLVTTLTLAGCPLTTSTKTGDTAPDGVEVLVDNGDGTSHASLSGLTWENEGVPTLQWDEAVDYCTTLGLAGGGWHLPTISELRTLIRGCPDTEPGGVCEVAEGTCDSVGCRAECFACDPEQGPTDGCYGPPELGRECDAFWSSTLLSDQTGSAWFVSFNDGHVWTYGFGNHYSVRCVRP